MKLESFVEILAAKNSQELIKNVDAVTYNLGFSNFVYGAYTKDKKIVRNNILTSANKDWLDYYVAQRYVTIDPRVHTCVKNVLPFHWDAKFFQKGKATLQLAQELRDVEAASGIAVRQYDKDGNLGMLNFNGSESLMKKMSDPDKHERFQSLLMLAVGISEVAFNLKGMENSTTSDGNRMIAQGGVKIDGEKVSDKALAIAVGESHIYQVGKRRVAKVKVVSQ